MLSKKKKIIILASMLVLLVITGYLNIRLNNSVADTTTNAGYTSANFFTTYRTDRTNTRNETMTYYDAIIESSSSSQEAKQLAEQKKAEILETITLENSMEGLIKAKGFSDAIVSYSDSYINVIVKSASLNENEVSNIVDVIQSQTQKDIDYIKIIPVE